MKSGEIAILDVIRKKLNNNVTHEEEKLLKEWILADKKNGKLFNSIKLMHGNKEKFRRYEKVDLDKAWYKLHRFEEKRRIIIKALNYAAVFILGILVFYSWDNISNQNEALDQQYHTITAPKGSKANIKLADGSSVIINGGSSLTFPVDFKDKNTREVHLSGEAFFDVARDENKPFHVFAVGIELEVLGTSFNFRAYPEDPVVEAYVASGKVKLELHDENNKEQTILLTAKEKVLLSKSPSSEKDEESSEIREKNHVSNNIITTRKKLKLLQPAEIEEEIAWKDEKFIFNDEPLEDLLVKLERWYGVDIHLNREGLGKYRFTGTFQKETIEEVMNAMSFAIPIKWVKKQKDITIYSNHGKIN